MTDTAILPDARPRPLRMAALAGVLVVALVALAISTWFLGFTRQWGWVGPVVALVAAGVVVAVVLMTRTWSNPVVWLAAVGFGLVVVGSGIGRRRGEIHTGLHTKFGGGDVIARLDTWWVVVALGLVLTLVGLGLAIRGGGTDRQSVMVATGAFLATGVGYAIVSFLMRDLVVGQWISGRPIRRAGRTRQTIVAASDDASPEQLWVDAAEDEAASVVAFVELAARLESVGAPGSLIERCLLAARDETRHARMCRRMGADPEPSGLTDDGARGDAAAPEVTVRSRWRRVELVRLAVESYVDGVIGEGYAARRLDVGASTASGTRAATIRSMAGDEARHAALGADIVRWSLDVSPLLVTGALRACARRLPERVDPPISHQTVRADQLQRAGLVDTKGCRELWGDQRTDALRWLDDALIGSSSLSLGVPRSGR